MNEQGSAIGKEDRGPPPVFISYATADRAEALKVCKAIERRGTQCWISMRDVPPGANYQEAIVQSLRTARAVVLVFSDAANTSDEIKKELSLASRYHVPVIALRLKDVEPSDAFAYELSTRQWINAFEGWDKSIDTLVGRIAQISGSGAGGSRGCRTRFPPDGFLLGAPDGDRSRRPAFAGCGCRRLVGTAAAPGRGSQHDGSPGGVPAPVRRLARNPSGYGGRGDHRGIQRRRRRGCFDCTSPGAGRSARLRTGRDDPAGRRHDPCHHSHGQRALRRNLVVRHFQLRRE